MCPLPFSYFFDIRNFHVALASRSINVVLRVDVGKSRRQVEEEIVVVDCIVLRVLGKVRIDVVGQSGITNTGRAICILQIV